MKSENTGTEFEIKHGFLNATDAKGGMIGVELASVIDDLGCIMFFAIRRKVDNEIHFIANCHPFKAPEDFAASLKKDKPELFKGIRTRELARMLRPENRVHIESLILTCKKP